MAKKQGEESWCEEAKAVLKNLKRTVTEHSRIFRASGRGSVRGKGFNMFEYKEFLESTRLTMGKMMWEEEWLDIALTVGGGS